ncbi:MAG: hypothetical protein COX80_04420 [Candidatus Magasanikbacteria bacterium CG_4_10_14_0_2_um_filter_33_14]|uniref:Uncharacterized protein n=1 Tax=Candidatus Magasanikbacteria bacterium CG_4_10_14_0_2_um_filter_33_14 TaxID=1974636 RepID=A0A2M7V9B1_9BACT|nr:MAG: hypothetical protein COX80_04420 [Candidatus Magasanikbacteria bacterium CG_4_10_14_0_2_um_filter_33_14]
MVIIDCPTTKEQGSSHNINRGFNDVDYKKRVVDDWTLSLGVIVHSFDFLWLWSRTGDSGSSGLLGFPNRICLHGFVLSLQSAQKQGNTQHEGSLLCESIHRFGGLALRNLDISFVQV